MDEFNCAWRTGLFVRLQQSGCAASVGSRTKHSSPNDDGNAARVGPGPATGNLERPEARTFARPCPVLGHSYIIGDSGSRARAWLADSDSTEWMVPDWRGSPRLVWRIVGGPEN